MRRSGGSVLALLIGVAACGEETPTSVGGGLLPTEAIRTFEVVLEPARFLVSDTAFGIYSDPPDDDFAILANRFENALDSRVLARFSIPTALTVVDSLGATRNDTLPIFFRGEIILIVDTVRSTAPPVRLALFRSTENWHEQSATWTLRVDTQGVRLPWAQAGGSPGVLVDTATFVAGRDTVILRVDSATIAQWRDTANVQRGAVIALQTAGARLRTGWPALRLSARSTLRRDTVFTTTVGATSRTYIFQPDLPDSASVPRVGGTPAWRTFLRLRDRIDTITVACPGIPNCRVKLSETRLNRAALLLQPTLSPAGFSPEGSIAVAAHLVLPAPGVPVHRSLLTQGLSSTAAIPRTSFTTAGSPVVELDLTELILAAGGVPTDTTTFRPSMFALLPSGDRTFGFGSFAALPALRLILSITKELQLP